MISYLISLNFVGPIILMRLDFPNNEGSHPKKNYKLRLFKNIFFINFFLKNMFALVCYFKNKGICFAHTNFLRPIYVLFSFLHFVAVNSRKQHKLTLLVPTFVKYSNSLFISMSFPIF